MLEVDQVAADVGSEEGALQMDQVLRKLVGPGMASRSFQEDRLSCRTRTSCWKDWGECAVYVHEQLQLELEDESKAVHVHVDLPV